MVSITSVVLFMTLSVGIWCRSRVPAWHRHFERRFNDLEKKVNEESLEFRDELLYLHEKITDNASTSVCASHDAEAAANVDDKENDDTAVTNVMVKTLVAGLGEEKEYIRRSLSAIKDSVDEHQDDVTETLEDLDRSLRDEISNVERSLIREMSATERQLLDKDMSHLETFERLDNEISVLNHENAKLEKRVATDKASCDQDILDIKTKYEIEINLIRTELKYVRLNFAKKPRPTCGSWHVFNDSCYSFVTRPAAWEEARDTCLSLGAYLAEVDDEDENLFLIELAKQNANLTGTYGPWIGASDLDEERTWRWSFSGRNVDDVYKGWLTNEPNGKRRENCLHLYKQGSPSYKWNDTGCHYKNGFICEK